MFHAIYIIDDIPQSNSDTKISTYACAFCCFIGLNNTVLIALCLLQIKPFEIHGFNEIKK